MTGPRLRICWPDPDATCLEGGCIHCQDAPLRALSTVQRWAESAGKVRNRGNRETKTAVEALRYGLARGRATT